MRKKYRVLSIITLYIAIAFIYLVFFLFHIENIPLYLFLTIGSVAVLSTGTIYTIVQSKSYPNKFIKGPKYFPKKKPIKRKSTDLVEDYVDTMPLLDKYVDAKESYEDIVSMDDFIFSIFNQEELYKIDLLKLSKMDKIFFIREMLYFDTDERIKLIDEMLKTKDFVDEQIIYTPPIRTIGMQDKIRVYIRSLVEPGEKTKIIIIETHELISEIKQKIGILFDYGLEDFLLSSGGILLDETMQIKDYVIDDDDEIALIPSRK